VRLRLTASSITLALGLIVFPLHAAATFGGPTIVQVLGWEISTNRVYFTVTAQGEHEWIPEVFYVTLGSSQERLEPVEIWDGPRSPTRKDEIDAQIRQLMPHLVRLREAFGESTEVFVSITETDSISTHVGPVVRFRQRATVRQDQFMARHEAFAYCRPGGRVVEWLLTPDPSVRLAVFSFVGDPTETCYEVQHVLALRKQVSSTR
jgi:hypothetical protein